MNIVFCLPGKSFSGKFLYCWTQLVGFCQQNGINLILSQRYNSNVYYVRPQCLWANVLRGKKQIPFNGDVQYDYIMWIDSDVLFTPDHFVALLKHDKDIVAGMYPMEGGTHYPIVQNWNEEYFLKNGTFEFLEKESPIVQVGELFESSYSGMGFMLVKKGVFETIEYPWFAPEFFEFGNGVVDFCSEDAGFCRKAQANGFKIWIDPKVIVNHEKTTVL